MKQRLWATFGCNVVESEIHVVLHCPLYVIERNCLMQRVNYVVDNFDNLNDQDKFTVLFTHQDLIRLLAKTCFDILRTRNNMLYSKNASSIS